MPRERVIAEIQACAGGQFDPALAQIFVKLNFAEFDRMRGLYQSAVTVAA